MKLKARWTEMDLFRKGLLILMLAAIPLFAMVTAVQCSRVGIQYREIFLRRTETDGVVQYAGRKDGQDIAFTVYPDGQVEHRWGNETSAPIWCGRTPPPRQSPLRGAGITETAMSQTVCWVWRSGRGIRCSFGAAGILTRI